MADWNGFKKNGTTYIPNDATARAGISTINGKIPTEASSSNKMATAANVIANTQLIKDTVGWSGKNLLKTLPNASNNGVTTTARSDGGYTSTSTNASGVNYRILNPDHISFMLPVGVYKLSVTMTDTDNYLIMSFVDGSTWTEKARIKTGQEAQFEVTANDVNKKMALFIGNAVVQGSAVNNIIYPMIRKANILDGTFEPYFGSTAFPRSEQAVLGAKNFAVINRPTTEYTGITFTVNSDGTITASGTATADSFFKLTTSPVSIKAGNYILNGAPSGASLQTYGLKIADSPQTVQAFDVGSGVNFTIDGAKVYEIMCFVANGTNLSTPITFKPMLRMASDTDNTFAPYAMTNRELTENSFYHVGSRIVVNHINCAAHLTSGGKDIVAFIPLNKPSKGVTGFTLPNNTQFIARANGTYIIQDGAVTNYDIEDIVVNDLGMQFVVRKKDDSAYTDQFNNMPVTFVIHGGPMTLT